MKKAIAIITIVFSMFLFTKTKAQWSEVGGLNGLAPNRAYFNSVVTDKAGNVYAAGTFTNANSNYFVAKYDKLKNNKY